jgi:chromosomal replication initiator protein
VDDGHSESAGRHEGDSAEGGSDSGRGGNDLSTVWATLIEDLPPNQRAWLAASRPVTVHEHTAIIAVADEFTRNQLEGRLRTRLEDSLTDALGVQVRIAVTVDPDLEPTPVQQFVRPSETQPRPDDRARPAYQPGLERSYDAGRESRTSYDGSVPTTGATDGPPPSVNRQIDMSTNPLDVPTPLPPGAGRSTAAASANVLETRLNPKYIFESFVIGSSNRFAHAAAVAVAEAPGKAYNPLLIYGDSGLGKTHLLHAIGHYVRSLFNGARVRYVSTEEFTNEFINAIRDDKAATFQRRYRDVDVLLIDDIQFLEGKIQTQEEFFHTFNTLHNANKQIVITSDRAPKRLVALEDRLRNRFEWGLITDVQPPDLETRIAILRKKAALERMTAPPDVLEFIASKIQTNIRELEGALIRVTAFASLNRQPVDLTLAEIVLKDLIPEGGEPEITAALIIAQTAAYFGLAIDDLCGASRSRVLVTARQIAMYLCRELTDLSLPKIGQQFGGRDHTTVMHADKKIRQLLAERRSVYNQVTELTNRIKQQARQG